MNLFERVARHPAGYRLVLRSARVVEQAERILRRLTRQRWGVLDLAGLPTLRISVPGRRSGLPRTATLQYVPDADRLLVIGSNWARPEHPAWTANLAAARRCAVRLGGQEFPATAGLLAGAARDEAWQAILAHWPNYALAQDRAGRRQFRIFELRRLG